MENVGEAARVDMQGKINDFLSFIRIVRQSLTLLQSVIAKKTQGFLHPFFIFPRSGVSAFPSDSNQSRTRIFIIGKMETGSLNNEGDLSHLNFL